MNEEQRQRAVQAITEELRAAWAAALAAGAAPVDLAAEVDRRCQAIRPAVTDG